MPKKLIIVESPAKANTISKFLQHKYDVKASMGHIRDLPEKELGVDVANNFHPVYRIDKKKNKVINELKEAARDAETIYLASDHDREGEAIAWHLTQVLEKELTGKEIYRIVFNEITARAIQEAIKNPTSIDMAKVDAQQARRVLDRIVGYTVSPLLWKVIAKKLSAGRVQSVALRLICEREEEIQNFVPKEYWKLEAKFYRDNIPPFQAALEKWDNKKIEIPDEATAQKLIEELDSSPAVISDLERNIQKLEPLPPFITSTLQQEASKILGFSPEKTMKVAQELYEGVDLKGERTGLITYMRTDSLRIANEAIENCRQLIKERFGNEFIHTVTRVYKNKSTAQDAHEAIRPTNTFYTPESIEENLTKDQLKLYSLIWQRFVATQMKPAKLRNTKVLVTVGKAIFSANGNIVEEEAFLKVYPYVKIISGETIDSAYVKGDNLEYDKIESSQHFTTPPSRYTEASLIKELEAKGIGRPSTYATIISTIRKRSYVSIEKKNFYPTKLGLDVNRFLVSNFDDIFNVSFTADMETKLDEVEENKIVWYELVKDYYEELMNLLNKVDVKKSKQEFIEETDIVCDVCKEGKMVIRHSTNGEFLSCNRFPACKNNKKFVRDDKGNIIILEPQTLEEKCPQCGSPLIERKGRYGEFIACSSYPKCKYSRNKTTGVTCPECGKGELIQRRNKKGNIFYSCNRYPECKFISSYKPIPISCPECGNPYLIEKKTREGNIYKECPKCKKRME